MPSFIIGRASSADILLEDVTISSMHLRIEQDNGIFHVTDLNSTNGSFIYKGSKKIKITQRLKVIKADLLFLGAYAVKVADLIKQLPNEDIQENKTDISRYIRADNGTYIGNK
jgi:pSer/pThr/pTyr-binding forkhead associated (FHA) protein